MHLNFVFGGIRIILLIRLVLGGLNFLLVVEVPGPQRGCRKTSLPK